MKNIIELLIDDFHERELPELFPRETHITIISGKANVFTGMRRSGKTWFCYQQMKELLAHGVEKERLLYLNFEDERLLPFSAGDFKYIPEIYYRKFPDYKNRQCYLFLDEAQRIDGWDKFVRRILDTEKLDVFITGSSSRLLSREIATSLRGRSLATEIFPFSFREYLGYHKIKFNTEQFGSRARALLQNWMGRYVKSGGFPEIQNFNDELRRQVLRNYVDVVILRDIIERYSVRNTVALRALIRHIMSAPATRFSVNKFYNSLKSQGIACTKNNLYAYLEYLTDSYLVYQVPIHSRSESVRRVNPKKAYAVDSGLLGAMSFQMTEDRGALLENIVYMQLRRLGLHPDYYITKDGGEVDFVIKSDGPGKNRLLQVCWELSDTATRSREMRALLSAMNELREERGTIITWMDEETIDERIEVIPAWKWLLIGSGQ